MVACKRRGTTRELQKFRSQRRKGGVPRCWWSPYAIRRSSPADDAGGRFENDKLVTREYAETKREFGHINIKQSNSHLGVQSDVTSKVEAASNATVHDRHP